MRSGTSPESSTSVPVAPSRALRHPKRASRPQLWLLNHNLETGMPRQRGLQGIRLVTNDDGHRTGRQRGGGQDVLDDRSARNRVKHFGQRRLHPDALAPRHDDVNVRHGVAPSPARGTRSGRSPWAAWTNEMRREHRVAEPQDQATRDHLALIWSGTGAGAASRRDAADIGTASSGSEGIILPAAVRGLDCVWQTPCFRGSARSTVPGGRALRRVPLAGYEATASI